MTVLQYYYSTCFCLRWTSFLLVRGLCFPLDFFFLTTRHRGCGSRSSTSTTTTSTSSSTTSSTTATTTTTTTTTTRTNYQLCIFRGPGARRDLVKINQEAFIFRLDSSIFLPVLLAAVCLGVLLLLLRLLVGRSLLLLLLLLLLLVALRMLPSQGSTEHPRISTAPSLGASSFKAFRHPMGFFPPKDRRDTRGRISHHHMTFSITIPKRDQSIAMCVSRLPTRSVLRHLPSSIRQRGS